MKAPWTFAGKAIVMLWEQLKPLANTQWALPDCSSLLSQGPACHPASQSLALIAWLFIQWGKASWRWWKGGVGVWLTLRIYHPKNYLLVRSLFSTIWYGSHLCLLCFRVLWPLTLVYSESLTWGSSSHLFCSFSCILGRIFVLLALKKPPIRDKFALYESSKNQSGITVTFYRSQLQAMFILGVTSWT